MPKIEGDWEALAIHKLEKLRLMFLKRIIFDIRVFFLMEQNFPLYFEIRGKRSL